MPKRTYWSRTHFKDIRLVYRKKPKIVKKYVSKAYRLYCKYIAYRFADGDSLLLMSYVMAEHMRMAAQRPSFMRMMLGKGEFKQPEPSAWYLAYKAADPGEYNRKKAYAVPDIWERWADRNLVTQSTERGTYNTLLRSAVTEAYNPIGE
jgi:hypothetical protein